jgi:hypothetical protein
MEGHGMPKWLIAFLRSRLFGWLFTGVFLAGLLALVLIALSPFLLVIFGTPAPGGGGENCDPSIYATVNAC